MPGATIRAAVLPRGTKEFLEGSRGDRSDLRDEPLAAIEPHTNQPETNHRPTRGELHPVEPADQRMEGHDTDSVRHERSRRGVSLDGPNGLWPIRASMSAGADISSGNNDQMSSWANNSSKNAAWFTDAKEKGDCHTMASNSNNYSLDIFSGNDAASSWQGQGC